MTRYAMGGPSPKTAVTVAAASTLVLAANSHRSHAIIQADKGNTEPIYLGFGAAAVQEVGPAIEPGQHWTIDESCYFTGAIYAICASGGQTARIVEA